MREAGRHVAALEHRISTLRAKADGLKGTDYSSDAHGGYMAAGDDAMAASVAEIIEVEARLHATMLEWLEHVEEFGSSLEMLDGVSAQLLSLRYCDGLEWSDVAETMHYSEVYVRRELATYALAALYDVMPHRYRSPLYPC